MTYTNKIIKDSRRSDSYSPGDASVRVSWIFEIFSQPTVFGKCGSNPPASRLYDLAIIKDCIYSGQGRNTVAKLAAPALFKRQHRLLFLHLLQSMAVSSIRLIGQYDPSHPFLQLSSTGHQCRGRERRRNKDQRCIPYSNSLRWDEKRIRAEGCTCYKGRYDYLFKILYFSVVMKNKTH